MKAAISMSVAGLALTGLLACAAAPAAAQNTAAEGTVRIAIPMYKVDTVGQGQSAVPAQRIEGDCGIAFLYLSRVDGDKVRAVYGFEKLENRSVAFTATATFVNEDTGHNAVDRASGPLRYRTSYQREATKYTGFGIVTVYAHLTAKKWNGGTCASSDRLNEQIFVY